MRCRCTQNGLANVVGRKAPLWVEVGQIHDVELNEGGKIPGNFEDATLPEKVVQKKGRGKAYKDQESEL